MPPEDRREEDELEEEQHRKVDKRASRDVDAEPAEDEAVDESAEGEDTGETAAEPEAKGDETEAEPAEATTAEQEEEGAPPEITVYGLLRMCIGMYAEQAWIHLGVRMDPNKQKTEQNIPLAKVAIDTVAFLVEQLQPDLTQEEKRELESLVANLRINYVQRS